MMFERSLNYNDICVIPNYSECKSRSFINLETEFLGQKYALPVAIANMGTLSNFLIMQKAIEYRIPIFWNRMIPIDRYIDSLKSGGPCDINDMKKYIIPTVGINDSQFSVLDCLNTIGYPIISIDVAHAHNKYVIEFVKKVKNSFDFKLIVGNIVTKEAAEDLRSAGADCLRINIGVGKVCSTKLNTGVTRGTVTTILETKNIGLPIISDGGFICVADMVKSLGLGSTLCMTGQMFASCHENSGVRFNVDGKIYTHYYGNASKQSKRYANYPIKNIEGFSNPVLLDGSFDDVISNISDGLRSGASYIGVDNIDKISTKFVYEIIS